MSTQAGSVVSGTDSAALVRRWESAHQRVLVDARLAGWEDLDSEAVVMARQHWQLAVPSGRTYWSRRRYLSFDRHGLPQRVIEVQVLPASCGVLRMRHADLLTAGLLGRRYWIYALAPAPGGQVHLRTYCDPAALAWDPAGVAGSSDGDPLWVMPVQRADVQPTLLEAA